MTGYKMVLGPDDKAYYFIGSQFLFVFDSKTLRWSTIKTMFLPDEELRTI